MASCCYATHAPLAFYAIKTITDNDNHRPAFKLKPEKGQTSLDVKRRRNEDDQRTNVIISFYVWFQLNSLYFVC